MLKKCCWVSRQYKKGWSLGFAVGNKPIKWLQGIRFDSPESVKNALNKHGVVFVEMDNAKV